ncbi:aminotransferase class V-fold PLP-dependent enzyme [Candidatus Acetothermia bacterium]|nr:aminotransferase class V-fold PLP-dependent enzyme [Candidatus Acetothermia bacterium]MBI3643407.1 aminotransferase class V-fold PLP-dependent enzyme [Candidatus Acetothermia bacterium]
MLKHWMLDPEVLYLNHGTVGAPPRRVLQKQQEIRDEIERQPSRYLLRDFSNFAGVPYAKQTKMRDAASAIASFVGAKGSDIVFVDNATTGINAVLRSLHFKEGDEILISDHAYGAIANAASFAARESKARLVTTKFPYPRYDPEAIIDAYTSAITSKTRLAIVDHISVESALLLPLQEIEKRCRKRGVPVLADGAHAPGAIKLDLPSLGVDWYSANLHKWAYSPRSCGFLWATPERQKELHPPVISWGLDKGFTHEFDWVGTRDPSPFLAAPEGIAFMQDLGVEAVRAYNHKLAWDAAQLLSESWGTEMPAGQEMIGVMATVPLPESLGKSKEDAQILRDKLLFEDKIEIQLHSWQNRLWVRISAQIYNDMSDMERLRDAVEART